VKITVHCESCSREDDLVEMKADKVMYVNRETKSQSQKYECPNCRKEVMVLVEIEEEDKK